MNQNFDFLWTVFAVMPGLLCLLLFFLVFSIMIGYGYWLCSKVFEDEQSRKERSPPPPVAGDGCNWNRHLIVTHGIKKNKMAHQVLRRQITV